MEYDDGTLDNVEMEVNVEKTGVSKKLVLNCELDVGYEVEGEEEGSDDLPSSASLYITDARLVPTNDQPSTDFEGPDYSTLDEELQTSMSDFVEAAVGDLSALGTFIDAYSGSKEGHMYHQWLSSVKDIVA